MSSHTRTPRSKRRSSSGSTSHSSPPGPPYASLALKLIRQEWSKLSLAEDTGGKPADRATAATAELEVLVERVKALLLVRIVACVATPGMFPDSSTTMICTTSIRKKRSSWPEQITSQVMQQLHVFVTRILSGYKDVPYHNREHAYHVILSVSKLLDMMTCSYSNLDESTAVPRKFRPPPSFGLRNEPLAMFALVFAALIHDVEHQGIPNRQLASENDRLAVLYNDQSIAENWSLYIAFSELLQDEFVDLRKVLFGYDLESSSYAEEYLNFRKIVVNMVLSTDIASPERSQVGKSKWKEAFGDPHETVEAKMMMNTKRRLSNFSNYSGNSMTSGDSSLGIIAPTIPEKESSSHHQEDDAAEEDPRGTTTDGSKNNLQGRNIVRRMTQESNATTVSDLTTSRRSSAEGGMGDDTVDNCNRTINKTLRYENELYSSLEEVDQDSVTPEHGEDFMGTRSDGIVHTPTSTSEEGQLPRDEGAIGELVQVPNHRTQRRFNNRSNLSSASDHVGGYSSLAAASDHPRHSSGGDGGNGGDQNSRSSLNQFLSVSHHRFESRMSRAQTSSKHYRQRLGILRTVDLGGETLQTYSRHDRLASTSASTIAYSVADLELDEPDELKMTVVMETMLAAADVAHNLQSWSHMLSWSKRLYFELRLAHVTGRGVDVSANWFENQIGFLESYILPLARRLEDTGVFGDECILPGIQFAKRVEDLRDEWLAKGYDVSQELIEQGAQHYPDRGGCGSSNGVNGSKNLQSFK